MAVHKALFCFLFICCILRVDAELPVDPVDLNEVIMKEMGYKKDGDGYTGEKNLEGEFHGLGVLTLPNGGFYAGEWKKGMKHGRGRVAMEGGDTYIGEWKFDRQHGVGTLTTSDGDKYTGKWKFGDQDGEGEYMWADGSSYVGHWCESEPSGYGISHEVKAQREYKGEWKNGKRHGRGVITSTKDAKVLFEGMFENDKPQK